MARRMTDTEIDREKVICEVAGVKEINDLSDGSHTFRQLYYQRMMLFATIVKQNRDKAWKSLRHEDGELCFDGGWFIVGIDTPEGSYTYHYEDNYYSLFDCEELRCGKHWDGHTEKDVTRLLSLPSAQPYASLQRNQTKGKRCVMDLISRQAAKKALEDRFMELQKRHSAGKYETNFCLNTILELPSINPQEMKIGKWILSGGYWRCSECKEKALLKLDKTKGHCKEYAPVRSIFCPNCGTKMEEVKE